MKTRTQIILLSIIVVVGSISILYAVQLPHYSLEIQGMKDTYHVGEQYSFYYTLSGFGHTCRSWTVSYPDQNGEINRAGEAIDCSRPANKELDYDSRKDSRMFASQVPKIVGKYNVTVSLENLEPVIHEFSVVAYDDFEMTWGGPGNRHPAFLGFDIPKICTEDMIKHLVRYSTMFDRNVPYSLEWISMDDDINKDDFDICVEELLERNSKELQNENLFHDKPLSYWKNMDENSLVQYYENLGNNKEDFFEDLGVFLIKSHSKEKLLGLGIIPADEMDIDWSGVRPSLPPRMGFDAKVNSTDGKNYLISGTIRGNEILDNFRIAEDNGRRIGWTPAFEYSRVQITGTTALQICSIMEITCTENPAWDAIHRHDKNFTFFHYDVYDAEPNVQIGEHYIQIDKDQICHSFEDMSSQQIPELECQEIRK